MEKLNLYTSKKRRVKLITLIIFCAIMLIPGIVTRVVLEFQWKSKVEELNLTYSTTLDIAHYRLRGNESDLDVLESTVKTYRMKADLMRAKQRKTVDFIKKAYLSKKAIKTIFNSWKKEKEDWMVLKELSWKDGIFYLDFYEIYKPGIKSASIILKNSLLAYGNVVEKKEFDVSFIEGLKMQKVVMKLNVGEAGK